MSNQALEKAPARKAKRVRSPAYPAVDLKKAVELAEILYDREGPHKAYAETVVTHWGYTQGSSSGMRVVAALLQFGLLDEEGARENRKVWLSDLGKSIVLDTRENSREKLDAIQKAALNPDIYSELWNEWRPALPSDRTIETHLLKKDFNKKAIAGFIQDFKATLEFARLIGPDAISREEPIVEQEEGDREVIESPQRRTTIVPPQLQADMRKAEISLLGGGGVAIVQVPYPMSKENVEYLIDVIKLMARGWVVEDNVPSANDNTLSHDDVVEGSDFDQ